MSENTMIMRLLVLATLLFTTTVHAESDDPSMRALPAKPIPKSFYDKARFRRQPNVLCVRQ